MINKRLIRTSRMSSRVSNEVQVHWHLHHPRILSLLAYFEDQENVYLVSELCGGGELYRFIKECPGGRLSESQVRCVMRDVVEGVEYLHAHSIIHRDLKLSNLLLTNDYRIISDYGLAVKLTATQEQLTLCGTPNYISPECINREPAGLSTDIWALGGMMYTMLVGSPPFEVPFHTYFSDNKSDQVKETLEKVSNIDYHVPSFVSREARDLIHRLLQKNPLKRPTIGKLLRHAFFGKNLAWTPLGRKEHVKINTVRLLPFEQSTKYGLIKIHADKSVSLEISSKMRMVVDAEGQGVQDRKTMEVVARYEVMALPGELVSKYTFMCRFIELVRAKTPKVVYYSTLAKCMLMENTPPDFELHFYSGVRVHHSVAKKRLKIVREGKEVLVDLSTEEVPIEFEEVVGHMQVCLKRCLEVEADAVEADVYPVIVGSRKDSGKSVHASTVSMVRNGSVVGGESVVGSVIGRSAARPLRPFTPSESIQTHISPITTQIIKRFIKGVGWCVKTSQGCEKFSVYFHDGCYMCVSVREHLLEYEDTHGERREYGIDRGLPQDVKRRLAYLPKFMALFQQ